MMNTFMNWRMLADVDNLEGNDRLHNKVAKVLTRMLLQFLDIYVLHPRTHIKDGKALYTDYEIHVKTNHPEFAIKESKVRRRYSEFVWLKNRLGINDVMMVTAPSLPGKRYFGRFKDSFLQKRQMGLQHFMNKVVEINAFLSDPALHFFLQSELPVSDMEYYLHQSGHLSNIRDRVIAMQKLRDKRETRKKKYEENRRAHNSHLKRNLSADSLVSSIKEPSKPVKIFTGRGWSRFIGYGYHNFSALDEADATDGRNNHAGSGAFGFRSRSSTATARVLPGGQLCLAESGEEDGTLSDSGKACPRKRPNSWHGKTNDIVDLWLEEYEVIDKNSDEVLVRSDIESISLSSASAIDNSASGSYFGSSDECDVVDLSRRLAEYNIIGLPKERQELFVHSEEND